MRSWSAIGGDTTGGCGVGTWSCGTNPARLSAAYFTAPGTLSRAYTGNGCPVAAAALRKAAETLPRTKDYFFPVRPLASTSAAV